MYEAFMRMAVAARQIFAALAQMIEAARQQPWWTRAPRSVQFARARRMGGARRARAPAGCRLHRRRI